MYPPPPLGAMADATRLTREGKLMQATRLLQRALRGMFTPAPGPTGASADPASAPPPQARPHAQAEDIAFRELPEAPVEESPVAADVQRRALPAPADAEVPVSPPVTEPVAEPVAERAPVQAPGRFDSLTFPSGGRLYNYRLFIPGAFSGMPPKPRPVLVLLHGCKQDAADFARGTAMNALAQEHECIVVYPEQRRAENQMGCWNWFEPAHQQRGSGEPEMIASLAREVADRHGGDADRIYVAGLSAGGAMAALVAQLYPDVFAAVGVHSGIGPGMAHDVVSAFTAMRRARHRKGTRRGAALPTIVFHGNADKTVHPSNGDQIVRETLAAHEEAGAALQVSQDEHTQAQRAAIRTLYSRGDGAVMLEYWEVAAGPHAWSGGNAAGSFTDPDGPSASEAMLRFFLQHSRAS